MKKLVYLAVVMVLLMVCFSLPVFAYSIFPVIEEAPVIADSQISIYVNDKLLKSDTSPIVQDGRTLVPLRAIAEALDIGIIWDPEVQSIFYYNSDDVGYYLEIGNKEVQIGQGAGLELQYQTIDVPPTIINGRTFVPLRFIAESLGANVDYDSSAKAVYVSE